MPDSRGDGILISTAAVTELAHRSPESEPRAYARSFAYRLRTLADSTWAPDHIDYVQLTAFLQERLLRCVCARRAVAQVTTAVTFELPPPDQSLVRRFAARLAPRKHRGFSVRTTGHVATGGVRDPAPSRLVCRLRSAKGIRAHPAQSCSVAARIFLATGPVDQGTHLRVEADAANCT